MTRYEISDNFGQIVKEAEDIGLDVEKIKEEILVRFLYKNGLLFDLTIKEFAILASLDPKTVWCHKNEWGFHKVAGALRTNIANFRTAMSGKGSQGDARNITKNRKMSSSNVAHSEIPAQRGKGD